jgi:hypothetical protein
MPPGVRGVGSLAHTMWPVLITAFIVVPLLILAWWRVRQR